MVFGKQGQGGNTLMWVALIGIGLFVLFGQGGGGGGTATTPSSDDVVKVQVQSSEKDANTPTFVIKDKLSPATDLATGTVQFVRVFQKNGDSWIDRGLVASGGTLGGASQGDKLKIYCGENSTSYYTTKKELTLGDKERETLQCFIYNQGTAPTLTQFNENDQVNTAQAVGSGEKRFAKVKITAASLEAFGNPTIECAETGSGPTQSQFCSKTNAMCIRSNSTEWEALRPTDTAKHGPYPGPTSITSNLSVAGMGVGCFSFPTLINDGSSSREIEIEVTIDAASGQNPTSDSVPINVTFWDVDYDLNAETLQEVAGIQDETSAGDLGVAINYGTHSVALPVS